MSVRPAVMADRSALTFSALPPLSLYIHIPWCLRKCPYCDFNSHEVKTPDAAIPEQDYVAALIADFEQTLPRVWGRRISSVFFGGGTPSLLSGAAVDAILAAVRARLPLNPDAEITLEANPGTVEAERFRDYRAAGVNRLMTMDFHADQLQGFFDIPVDHLKSEPIFAQYLKDNIDLSNVLFASPDLGGVKRARNFARILERDFVTCSKYRKKANEIAEMNVIGDVEGMDVVLVDDLIDTAGTLCKAAEVIMSKGAKSVRAMATHPVLSGKAYENIEKSMLTEVIVCDTIPLHRKSDKIKVISTGKLFARAIRNTHENRSIEALFDM